MINISLVMPAHYQPEASTTSVLLREWKSDNLSSSSRLTTEHQHCSMPLYDIEHVIPLTDGQQESLAKAFTSIHCTRFYTPSFFINVRFTDVSSQKVYRGGVLRYYNRAILRTRVSENRTSEQYGEHCRELMKAWDGIITRESVNSEHETTLRTVWVMGALTTAVEMGFQRPAAGQEIRWLRDNKASFETMANNGDEDMQQLMVELRSRDDFADILQQEDAIH